MELRTESNIGHGAVAINGEFHTGEGSILLLGEPIDDQIVTTPMDSQPPSPVEDLAPAQQLESLSDENGFGSDEIYDESFESLTAVEGIHSDMSPNGTVVSKDNSNQLAEFSSITFNNSALLAEDIDKGKDRPRRVGGKKSKGKKKGLSSKDEVVHFSTEAKIAAGYDRLSSSRGHRVNSSNGAVVDNGGSALPMTHFLVDAGDSLVEEENEGKAIDIKHPFAVTPSGAVHEAQQRRKGTPHKSALTTGLPPTGQQRKKNDPFDNSGSAPLKFEIIDVGSTLNGSTVSQSADTSITRFAAQGPVTSVVSKDAAYSYNPAVLQRQLHTALQRVSAYKKANDLLQRKLDDSNIEEAVEKYRALLFEKEQQINDLQNENSSLKQIAHTQGRKLQDNALKERDPLDTELTQDKQIEIMVTHVRKIRAKLVAAYDKQHELEAENQKLLKLQQKTNKKNVKLRRDAHELRDMNEQLKQHLINALASQPTAANLDASVLGAATAAGLQQQTQDDDEDSTGDFRHINQELSTVADGLVAALDDAKGKDVICAEELKKREDTTSAIPSTAEGADTGQKSMRGNGDLLHASGIPLHLLVSTQSASSSRRNIRSSSFGKPRSSKFVKENERLREENTQLQLRLQALQKNLDVHRATSQHELQSQKTSAEKASAEQKRLAKELHKRELFARTQMITLKQLRAAYEELAEANANLEEVSELYNRDAAPQVRSKPSPVAERFEPTPPPLQKRPSTANTRKLAPKAAVISEVDDGVLADTNSGNMTFMTSAMDDVKK